MYNYQKTKYSHIFIDTYWGGFEYRKEDDYEIIQNRNKFVKEPYRDVFDHVELYRTKSKEYVIIVSPYHKPKLLLKMGFKEIYPLYKTCATTYYIKLQNKKELFELNKQILTTMTIEGFERSKRDDYNVLANYLNDDCRLYFGYGSRRMKKLVEEEFNRMSEMCDWCGENHI